jgi:hypothetical protein
MRIERVEDALPDGSYARALRVVSKHLPHASEDVEDALALLRGPNAPPVPSPPAISLIPRLGPNATVVKVRVRSRDSNKGKSGGMRLLLQRLPDGTWRRLVVYAKNEREDISRDEILRLIAANPK